MNQIENVVKNLADLWHQLGYNIEEQEPSLPLNICLIASRMLGIPLGRYYDLWIVCTTEPEIIDEKPTRKKQMQKWIQQEFAPSVLRFTRLKPRPFVNFIVLGDNIDPNQEIAHLSPDNFNYGSSTFCSVTAFNTTTSEIEIGTSWAGFGTSKPMLKAITQLLITKSLATEDIDTLRKEMSKWYH